MQLLTRMLSQAGVEIVFGLSGNQIMPVYNTCLDEGIGITHVRHEAAAVTMADAYAQITGQLGIALSPPQPSSATANPSRLRTAFPFHWNAQQRVESSPVSMSSSTVLPRRSCAVTARRLPEPIER